MHTATSSDLTVFSQTSLQFPGTKPSSPRTSIYKSVLCFSVINKLVKNVLMQ